MLRTLQRSEIRFVRDSLVSVMCNGVVYVHDRSVGGTAIIQERADQLEECRHLMRM